MIKILMITGDAGEAQEIYYAKFRLEEEGWQVHIAAPEKRAFLSVVHDFEPGFDTYTEKPGYRVQADLGLDEVVAERLRRAGPARRPGAGIPAEPREGGRHRPALRRDRQADRGQLPRSAAGPGRRRRPRPDDDRYPDLEPDIRSHGVEFVNREVVVDGTLVTVRGWPDNGPWMREFVRLLKAKTVVIERTPASDRSPSGRGPFERNVATAMTIDEAHPSRSSADRSFRPRDGRPWHFDPTDRAWF